MDERILIIGAFGQIGSELLPILRQKVGKENVVALDINPKPTPDLLDGPYVICDGTDKQAVESAIQKYKINVIYHLACILSATGEKIPHETWRVNLKTLRIVLDLAIKNKIKVFWPSSIAVFGPTTPKEDTPQNTILEPTTMYGITKVTGELLCHYYHYKFGIDVRSLRYPGLISWKTEPGGGTTDYAVAIFYEALRNKKYTSYVKADTKLPMMYMDDAVRATMELMYIPEDHVTVRTSYNLSAMSFSVQELADEIKKHIPDFEISYKPDKRQLIADSWVDSVDDSRARQNGGWKHEFDLTKMTVEMLDKLRAKLGVK